jgi:ABC-type transporter Mla MlaB component
VRVTIQDANGRGLIMKIEGKISGLLVPELRRAWLDLAPSIGQRKLMVDLCGVTHVDGTGQALLAEIHANTGAEFAADTPLTKYFAQEATRDSDNTKRDREFGRKS